jgi:hypothetical protein
MIVWADTAKLTSVEEVPVFKHYNKLIKKIDYYSNSWYKGLNDISYESTKTIIDEWNKTHKRKITSVTFDWDKKEYNYYYKGDIVANPTKSPFKQGHRQRMFTVDENFEIVEEYENGVPVKALAKKWKTTPKTIRNYLARLIPPTNKEYLTKYKIDKNK